MARHGRTRRKRNRVPRLHSILGIHVSHRRRLAGDAPHASDIVIRDPQGFASLDPSSGHPAIHIYHASNLERIRPHRHKFVGGSSVAVQHADRGRHGVGRDPHPPKVIVLERGVFAAVVGDHADEPAPRVVDVLLPLQRRPRHDGLQPVRRIGHGRLRTVRIPFGEAPARRRIVFPRRHVPYCTIARRGKQGAPPLRVVRKAHRVRRAGHLYHVPRRVVRRHRDVAQRVRLRDPVAERVVGVRLHGEAVRARARPPLGDVARRAVRGLCNPLAAGLADHAAQGVVFVRRGPAGGLDREDEPVTQRAHRRARRRGRSRLDGDVRDRVVRHSRLRGYAVRRDPYDMSAHRVGKAGHALAHLRRRVGVGSRAHDRPRDAPPLVGALLVRLVAAERHAVRSASYKLPEVVVHVDVRPRDAPRRGRDGDGARGAAVVRHGVSPAGAPHLHHAAEEVPHGDRVRHRAAVGRLRDLVVDPAARRVVVGPRAPLGPPAVPLAAGRGRPVPDVRAHLVHRRPLRAGVRVRVGHELVAVAVAARPPRLDLPARVGKVRGVVPRAPAGRALLGKAPAVRRRGVRRLAGRLSDVHHGVGLAPEAVEEVLRHLEAVGRDVGKPHVLHRVVEPVPPGDRRPEGPAPFAVAAPEEAAARIRVRLRRAVVVCGGPEAALVVVHRHRLVYHRPAVGQALRLPQDKPVRVVHLDDLVRRELHRSAPPTPRQDDAAAGGGHIGHRPHAVLVHFLSRLPAHDERHAAGRHGIEHRAPRICVRRVAELRRR